MKMRYVLAPIALLAAMPAAAQVMTPAEYVMTASASDMFERESAKLVLATTTDPMVRDFATMMLTAHAQSTAQVKAAAMRSKVSVLPPMLNAAQTEMLAQLRALSRIERDTRYIAQQKAAHGQALAVQEAYAQGGTAAPLRMAAGKIVPVVKDHIKMLMTM